MLLPRTKFSENRSNHLILVETPTVLFPMIYFELFQVSKRHRVIYKTTDISFTGDCEYVNKPIKESSEKHCLKNPLVQNSRLVIESLFDGFMVSFYPSIFI